MDHFIILLVFSILTCSRAAHVVAHGKDADSYQNMDNFEDTFSYGYLVRRVNDQYQHKIKTANNVTYGCYGYTQQDVPGVHRVFYVADQFGYRTVTPGRRVITYPTPGKTPVVNQWDDLPFPVGCFQPGVNDLSMHSKGTITARHNTVEDTAGSATENHSVKVNSTSGECWHPFLDGNGRSFIQNVHCNAKDQKQEDSITLFYPFRVTCNDMIQFQEDVQKLISRYVR